jgi:hypothetical protein
MASQYEEAAAALEEPHRCIRSEERDKPLVWTSAGAPREPMQTRRAPRCR